MVRPTWLFLPSLLLLVNAVHSAELPLLAYSQTCAAEGGGRASFRMCMAAQQAAKRRLPRNWGRYPESQRVSCVAEASGIAGVASYIELLTCLQLDRGAARLDQRWFER